MFASLTRKQSILLRCLHFSASSAINIPATRRTGQQDRLGHHDQHGGLGGPLRTGWSGRTRRKYPPAPPGMTARRKPGAGHIASSGRSPSACISVYPVESVLKFASCDLATYTVGGCQAPQTRPLRFDRRLNHIAQSLAPRNETPARRLSVPAAVSRRAAQSLIPRNETSVRRHSAPPAVPRHAAQSLTSRIETPMRRYCLARTLRLPQRAATRNRVAQPHPRRRQAKAIPVSAKAP